MRYICLIISCSLQTCLACSTKAPKKKTNSSNTEIDNPKISVNLSDSGKWNSAHNFTAWLEEFNRMQEAMQKEAGEFGLDKPADAGPYWPPHWTGLGPGLQGVPPPPWAYLPKNTDKPAFCYDPPEKGTCDEGKGEESMRWGYNPYKDECMEYAFSGCRGTQNNFKTKEGCQRSCIGASQGGCDPDSHITKDELLAH